VTWRIIKIHTHAVLYDHEFIDRIADMVKPGFMFLLTMIWGLKYKNIGDANARFSAMRLSLALNHNAFDCSHAPSIDCLSLTCQGNLKKPIRLAEPKNKSQWFQNPSRGRWAYKTTLR
jgi:hypothetical protein